MTDLIDDPSAHLRRIMDAAEEALDIIGDDLESEVGQRAPVDTGLLRSSASHEVNVDRLAAELVVKVSTPYAAVQHERTDYRHPRGGEAKYLERPLLDKMHRYADAIAANVKRANGG